MCGVAGQRVGVGEPTADPGAKLASEEVARDSDGAPVLEVHDHPGSGTLWVDGDDGPAGAVAEVAARLAGRVELLRRGTADHFVAGLELVTTGVQYRAVEVAVRGQEDAGAGVEGTTFAVVFGDHARWCVRWVSLAALAVDPPVCGELVEELFCIFGEHDALVGVEPVEGLHDVAVAVLVQCQSKFGELGSCLAAQLG